MKVPVIEDGMLVNYLLGREPIRDFPESNGHGRAAPGQSAAPNIGNLIVQSKQPLSPEQLKQKLIDICRQDNKPFGYYVETLGGIRIRACSTAYTKRTATRNSSAARVSTNSTRRTLRNDLVAAGNDPLVGNREGAVPTTVIAPRFCSTNLEVKRTDTKNAKLPEYPPPDLIAAH